MNSQLWRGQAALPNCGFTPESRKLKSSLNENHMKNKTTVTKAGKTKQFRVARRDFVKLLPAAGAAGLIATKGVLAQTPTPSPSPLPSPSPSPTPPPRITKEM